MVKTEKKVEVEQVDDSVLEGQLKVEVIDTPANDDKGKIGSIFLSIYGW